MRVIGIGKAGKPQLAPGQLPDVIPRDPLLACVQDADPEQFAVIRLWERDRVAGRIRCSLSQNENEKRTQLLWSRLRNRDPLFHHKRVHQSASRAEKPPQVANR
jgi:hypothetical protein